MSKTYWCRANQETTSSLGRRSHTTKSTSRRSGAPLKEFNVIAFPDNGAYDQWHQTATSMNELGFSIEVSTAIEDASYETGWDLVDVFLFEESKPETPGDEG